jgi:PAS domain S-box-containing protein
VQRRVDAPAEDVIVDFVFQPVRLADGTIDGVFVAGHDVTDHHLAVAEAAARERETRFLAEHVPMQVWTADTTGGLTFVNRVTTDFLGAPLMGLGWQAVIHPDDLDATAARWAAALRSGEPYEAEFRLRRHDGEYRWHIARAVPFRAASGDITKWYGCTAEIDDHKQLELQREASIEMLRSRNADLQRFASVLTHDVKAPLRHVANLATWASDDLREGSQASAVEHLDLLAQRARALGELVEGVLRASVGGVDESVELGTVAREAVAMLGARAGMEVEIADGLPTLVGPRVGLKQLMLNLVANAMVHGRDGGWLRIDHDEGADGPRVLVRDRGRGIPPGQRESVWAERSTGATPTAGTGIGLSVVRRLVESRGGRVGVEETPGGGATVWFTWPRASAR